MKKQIIAALAVGAIAVTALPVGASADYAVPETSPIYCVTAAKPAKPTLVKGYVSTRNSVTIRWNKVKNATGYRVYFYNAATKKWKAVKTTKTLSYKKTGLKAGTKYKFKVRAFKKSGKKTVWGKYSAVKNVVTTPAAVTLKVGGISTNTATLSWNKVSCDSVQIQQNNNGKWTSVATVSKSTTSYTLTGLKASTRYTYRVRAYIKDADKTATRYSSCEKVFTTYPDAPETTPTSTTTTTTAPASKPTSTTTTTTTTSATAPSHVHSWNPVYKTIEHPAEYATKTIWMYSPLTYDSTKLNAELPYGPNRIIFDNDRNFTRKNYYDLLCYKYGSIYNIPNEYIVEWITKDNYSDYSLSYKEFCRLPMTNYGNGNVVTFNPDLDIFVGIHSDAVGPEDYGWSGGSDCWEDEYQAVAQETVKTKDAWTETVVDHYECSCGATKK